MTNRIVIVTGPAPLAPQIVELIPDDATLLAVDGGLDHALVAGLQPSELIGDLDSITDDGLAWAARHADIARFPTDKEQTDTELALAKAATMDPDQVTLIGGGDRLDHTLAGIGALGAPGLTSIPVIDAWWSEQHIRVLHGPGSAVVRVMPGSTLSLLALHGPCTKVTLTGTRWELDRIDLDPVVGLGVSNEVAEGDEPVEIDISLSTGILTIFDDPAPEPDEPDDEDADTNEDDPGS